MAQSQDTEISLGTGKLLGLFFGLVLLCGTFFGVGYLLGRNTTTAQQQTPPDVVTTAATTGGTKPSSTVGGVPPQPKPQDCSTSGAVCDQQSSGSELTFYKTVEQKDVPSQLIPAEQPSASEPQKAVAPAPENARATATASGSYVVQVAAVSKQQDADALVSALRKKQYPVFVTSNPPSDKLFHVQAGPFADMKEAEGIKMRLTNDGYSPILKR